MHSPYGYACICLLALIVDSPGFPQEPAVPKSDTPQLPPDTGDTVVAVILHFERSIAPAMRSEMQNEVERLLQPAGLKFQWWHADEEWFGAAPYVITARFRGTCKPQALARARGSFDSLGRSHVQGGRLMPFCDIECERVASFIHVEIFRADVKTKERLLGIALGRVLAHELYHILANTPRHGRKGLSGKGIRPDELVGPNMEFDPTDADRIRRTISPAAARVSGKS